MPVHEDEDVFARGRIAPHDLPAAFAVVHRMMRKCRRARQLLRVAEDGDGSPEMRRKLKRARGQRRMALQALAVHFSSYDMVARPVVEHAAPEMTEPWDELTEAHFREVTGWSTPQFLEAADKLTLLPAEITTAQGCKVSRRLAFFTCLRRWSVTDTLRAQGRFQRTSPSRLTDIINTTIKELMLHYKRLVLSFDFLRIIPCLKDWADAVAESSPGGSPHVVCWADGKPWKFEKPGSGQAAQEAAAALQINVDDIQRSFYNKNYKGTSLCGSLA